MSDYSFSEEQKVSIWRADGEKCFYCRIPVPYSELQVDHIVPEKVSAEKLAELKSVLPVGFAINSIPNWATCHQGCNNRKNAYVFETPMTVYLVGMATKRAPAIQKNIADFQIQKDNGRLLSTLKVRLENGHLAQAAVWAVLGDLPAPTQGGSDPWVVAFGANFLDPLPIEAPQQDPQRSDWLLERLGRDLAATGAVFRKIDDDRSGEDVSVRYAFWLLDLDRVTKSIEFCWEVLAVQKYSDLFETSADDLLDRAVVSRYHQIVHSAPNGDPVGLSACPDCGSTDLEYKSFSNGEDDTIYEVTCKDCGHQTTS